MDTTLNILPPSVSDLALLSVEGLAKVGNYTGKFKFYNSLVDMVGYDNMVSNSWNQPLRGIPVYVLWHKLRRLQPELKAFSKSSSNVNHNMVKARRDLEVS